MLSVVCQEIMRPRCQNSQIKILSIKFLNETVAEVGILFFTRKIYLNISSEKKQTQEPLSIKKIMHFK